MYCTSGCTPNVINDGIGHMVVWNWPSYAAFREWIAGHSSFLHPFIVNVFISHSEQVLWYVYMLLLMHLPPTQEWHDPAFRVEPTALTDLFIHIHTLLFLIWFSLGTHDTTSSLGLDSLPCFPAHDHAEDVSLMRRRHGSAPPTVLWYLGQISLINSFLSTRGPYKRTIKASVLSRSLAGLCLSIAVLRTPTQDALMLTWETVSLTHTFPGLKYI